MGTRRNLPEGTTGTDELGKAMGLTKKQREAVYKGLGLSPDGE